jgi:phosphohistidine swiveling domain-containing protein
MTEAAWIYRHTAGDELPTAALLGGKAKNLARLAGAGVEVPPWIAITTDAFRELSAAAGTPRQGEVEAWQAAVRGLALPSRFRAALAEALRAAGLGDGLLAVRSSAASEDGAHQSFAGQFDSVLGVRPAEVPDALLRVWASAGNEHALAYGSGATPMGVVIQRMVDAEVSGVAFGADPVSGRRDVVVVSAVFGLGEGLVSGEMDADSYRVDFSGPAPVVTSTLAASREAIRMRAGGGTERVAVAGAATLTEASVLEIAAAVRRVGEALGGPQDVEWSIAGGRLYLLQARPITTLAAAVEGERRVWDNSNIVESYAGVTSPLTFSFALGVYEEVYRQFCSVVGVPRPLVEEHRHVFANMLGLVRGRVYYNLLNWYRTLALLPGYTTNRAFMERMMGVREKLADPPALAFTSGRAADAARLLRMVGRLVRESRGLRAAVPAFHARVEAALRPLAKEDLSGWDADRLARLYRGLEDELLRNWQAPLVNDFFAMIWFGVLGKLVESWLPESPPTLVNDLLTSEGGIVSTEPARLVRRLAELAREAPAVRGHFEGAADAREIGALLAADPAAAAFRLEVDGYLERFGDRCMNELKLETITLSEDPSFLYQTIRGYLGSEAREGEGAAVRAAAEATVEARLSGVRRLVFRRVLAQTRARVRDRENLRFERTRVFGAVRRIVLGLGAGLERAGLLADARDVFYLRIEELFAQVEGTATGSDLRALVELRRAEWAEYAATPAPPDRFESIGPVSLGRWVVPDTPRGVSGDGRTLQGIGCCPGLVRAPVRLVRDPRDAGDLAGRILVAERTDPGWTLLFPVARGLLVERGSLLSHSAIVAREVGLPCVVSIPGLLETLVDGEVVEMDGTTGSVRRVDG